MALNWGVTDVLAVTKLAWDLYHNCFLVARGAPEDFRQLVNELASLQLVLRSLRDDISSDKSFLDRLAKTRKEALERALSTCFDTLRQLQSLVSEYSGLASSDGLQIWKKLKWVTKQTTISGLKSKIMAHTCHISLCMSSIGNSSLNRIETQLTQALQRQDKGEIDAQGGEDGSDELAPLPPVTTMPVKSPNPNVNHLNGLNRALTGTTLHDSNTDISSESTLYMSDEDASEFTPLTAGISNGRERVAPTRRRQSSVPSTGRDHRALPPGSGNDGGANVSANGHPLGRTSQQIGQSTTVINGFSGTDNPENFAQVIADANKQLSNIRRREQSLRPLRVIRQDPDRRPDKALCERFQKSADDELKIRVPNVKDWLRAATWWLLKSKHNMCMFEKPEFSSSHGSFSASGSGKSLSNQAYVDLLKASWILYTIIYQEENSLALTKDENRKLLYSLSDGIDEEFSMYKAVDTPEKDAFLEQNCNIWEFLQPEEETYDERDFLLGVDYARWITIDQEDAGEEHETVLFRTFVNASIGEKRYRMKSRGAPYLLILSTKAGESEPKVTICNQIGSLGLSRDFTTEDLSNGEVPTSPFSDSTNLNAKDVLPLNFERMNISIAFSNENDRQKFMAIPRAYFDAVKRREPRQLEKATEKVLFEHSVEIFEILNSSVVNARNPQRKFQSCNLRVLETTGVEGWRTTRRLVISSSASETQPWLAEFFLPLSRVQISRLHNPKNIRMKWSDCNQRVPNLTDGNWNEVFTYVYDDSKPNIALSFLFHNSDHATKFEDTVLRLSSELIFQWTKVLDTGSIYRIIDAEPSQKIYKALLLTRTRSEWRYSELFYVYRDTDYDFDYDTGKVWLPQISYTNYVSNHVGNLYPPDSKRPPRFSHCEKKVGNVLIDFEDVKTSMDFMSSLTRKHKLIYSRRSLYVSTKPPSRFGSPKSNKGPAEVQLWKDLEEDKIRLVLRWGGKVEDKWVSLAVPDGVLDDRRDSNRATLPRTEYKRGRKIDMANLIARDCSKENEWTRNGPITIAFKTVRDKEQFADALEGKDTPITTSPTKENPFSDDRDLILM